MEEGEIGMIRPQTKECQQPLEMKKKGKESSAVATGKERSLAKTLILAH